MVGEDCLVRRLCPRHARVQPRHFGCAQERDRFPLSRVDEQGRRLHRLRLYDGRACDRTIATGNGFRASRYCPPAGRSLVVHRLRELHRIQTGGDAGEERQRHAGSRGCMERRITAFERQPRREMMTRDLGVWTYENSALVLIDYQKEMFETIRSETSAELADLNVRLLARTAKAFDMPIVLSTVGVKFGINGPTHASILSELPGVEPIDRTSMNAFEDRAFSDAVKKTGRKRLILGGLHTEICLTFAVVQALKDGYEGMFVTD